MEARGIEPDSHTRVLPRKPWHILRQYLVDALLLGVLNPLADLLSDAGLLSADRFWGMTRGEIGLYAGEHPQYADRLTATGLLDETLRPLSVEWLPPDPRLRRPRHPPTDPSHRPPPEPAVLSRRHPPKPPVVTRAAACSSSGALRR
ncbi:MULTISPECIES: ferric iron reductase [Kribbella]|uniref:ferric iron reductase n=1 Tax=Kribbella TaxID=182639 RepID=UPI001F541129|nr:MULTISPECIES: ferric iron reductase [Kribbella]